MRRSILCSLLLPALLALSGHAHAQAQAKDGAFFLQACNAAVQQAEGEKLSPQDTQAALSCSAYLTGFMDAVTLNASTTLGRRSICFPEGGVSDVQAAGIFVKYLRQNPQSLQSAGRASLYVALVRAFSCSK
jgi:glucose/arabinose dehydrogenase